MIIKAGGIVNIKPEWLDQGEENTVFRAIDDLEKGRVMVAAEIGLSINPTSIVHEEMIQP